MHDAPDEDGAELGPEAVVAIDLSWHSIERFSKDRWSTLAHYIFFTLTLQGPQLLYSCNRLA